MREGEKERRRREREIFIFFSLKKLYQNEVLKTKIKSGLKN